MGLDRFLVILFWIRSGTVALLFDFGMALSCSSGVKATFRGSAVRDRILFLIATSKCLLSAERAWLVAEASDPFPTMFLTKAHIFGWSFGPRLAMKADHAFFLDVMMVLLFLASAFLHSSLFVVDFGESLHSLKARLASFTAVLHSSSYHGRAGPLCDTLQLWLVLLNNCSLLASRPSVNIVVAVAGSVISMKFWYSRSSSNRLFQAGHFSSLIAQAIGRLA